MEQVLVEPHPEMAGKNTYEKYPRNAQRYTAYADTPKRYPARNYERQYKNRMGDTAAP